MPDKWMVCMLNECPRHDTCLRFRAMNIINERHSRQNCVLPSALRDGCCRYFVPDEEVTVAWGMKTLFLYVSAADATRMRPSVKALFKSHSTYYRYYHGRYPISPSRQQTIRRIFERFGCNPAAVRFDRVEQSYFFPQP